MPQILVSPHLRAKYDFLIQSDKEFRRNLQAKLDSIHVQILNGKSFTIRIDDSRGISFHLSIEIRNFNILIVEIHSVQDSDFTEV